MVRLPACAIAVRLVTIGNQARMDSAVVRMVIVVLTEFLRAIRYRDAGAECSVISLPP